MGSLLPSSSPPPPPLLSNQSPLLPITLYNIVGTSLYIDYYGVPTLLFPIRLVHCSVDYSLASYNL